MTEKQSYRLGFWLAIGAAVGFSAKAIFVKLAYQVPPAAPGLGPVDAVTLLALRMGLSLPFFLALGFADGRRRQHAKLSGRDLARSNSQYQKKNYINQQLTK